MFYNPFQRVFNGIVFEVSQDLSCVVFVKQHPTALIDNLAIWEDNRLLLNGIAYEYNRFHSIEGNSELKKYLSEFMGYGGEKCT